MARLSKRQAAKHAEACKLIARGSLTHDERWFVLEHWQESANHINSVAGAFFTPPGLARDFTIEVSGRRIIDLCAGIGTLSLMALWHLDPGAELVCVELNPDYIEVGRRLLPEAQWIQADIFDLPALGHFDCAISNPPFGAVKRSTKGAAYRGRCFEYHVIEAASRIADYGVFIVPQESAPFAYSGRSSFEKKEGEEYLKFHAATGITLGNSCGIDTDVYAADWHGVSPRVEIVCCDFEARRAAAEQGSLLDLLPKRHAA